jgi:hypothetical protein
VSLWLDANRISIPAAKRIVTHIAAIDVLFIQICSEFVSPKECECLRPYIGRIIGGAGDPVLQLGHGEIGDRPIIGMVFAVDDQRFQHRFGVGRINEIGEVFSRPAGGRFGPYGAGPPEIIFILIDAPFSF